MTRTRLYQWRLAHGLSLNDSSDLSGISISMWSRLERGERGASVELKLRFARALGVPIRALFDPPPMKTRVPRMLPMDAADGAAPGSTPSTPRPAPVPRGRLRRTS
jgi:transcriptional regulator with XRE-family HTH domain